MHTDGREGELLIALAQTRNELARATEALAAARRTLPQPGSIGLTAYEQRLADDLKRAMDRVSDLETALHIADAMREKHLANLRACMEKRDAAEARVAELESAIRWALGEEDDFPPREPERGQYWWRTELRRRAKLAARAALAGGGDRE